MRYLILINNAPKYIYYLKALGNQLKKEGHEVVYAIEHKIAEDKEKCYIEDDNKYYFNEFENTSKEVVNKYNNINLNKTFYSCFQRHMVYEYKECLKNDKNLEYILVRLLNFYEEIIDKEKIECVIYENVSNSYAYIAYEVSKRKKVKYLGFITSRIPNRFELWTDEYGNINERELYFKGIDLKNIDSEELESIEKYIANISDIKPDYMKNNLTSMNISYTKYYINKVGYLSRILLSSIKWKEGESYQNPRPILHSISMLKRNLNRKIKIKKLIRKYDEVNFDEKYFVYPMHFQPESSTSVNAVFYDNQFEIIKNIAFSLPFGTRLYVKDHPNGIGFFDLNFYNDLKKLPNVKYINPLANNKMLIKNSCGIVTLTSTMGYEALLMNKPVLTLGKVFYNFHPYCFNIESYNDIFYTLNKMCNGKLYHFYKYNIKFVKTYRDTTYEGKLFRYDNEEEVKKVSNKLIELCKK